MSRCTERERKGRTRALERIKLILHELDQQKDNRCDVKPQNVDSLKWICRRDSAAHRKSQAAFALDGADAYLPFVPPVPTIIKWQPKLRSPRQRLKSNMGCYKATLDCKDCDMCCECRVAEGAHIHLPEVKDKSKPLRNQYYVCGACTEPNFVVTIARRAIEENEFELSDPRTLTANADHLNGNFLFCIILLTLSNEPSSPSFFDRLSEIVLAHDRLSEYLKEYVMTVVRCFEFTDFSNMRPVPMVLEIVSPDSASLRTDLLGRLLTEISTPNSVVESVVGCLNAIKECDMNQLPTDKLVHVVESSRVLPESFDDINPVLNSLVTLFYGESGT